METELEFYYLRLTPENVASVEGRARDHAKRIRTGLLLNRISNGAWTRLAKPEDAYGFWASRSEVTQLEHSLGSSGIGYSLEKSPALCETEDPDNL